MSAAVDAPPKRLARRPAWWLAALAGVIVLAVLPFINVPTGGVLPDRLSAPGSLQLLGLCLVFGALALTYDLLFGFTGLLSFGHALFFAVGAYSFDIAVTVWGLNGWEALGVTVAVALLLAAGIGAVSLRTSGIAFAMVTLAFAQAWSVIVTQNPGQLTGGELGLGLSYERLPELLVGVVNTRYLYWLALALLVLVCGVVWWVSGSVTGRVWRAIRENERRVQVLGLNPYVFKLVAFVTASFLAAIAGVAYLFLIGSANPAITTAEFTLSLLVMVVLGGAGTGWGAVVGGVVYTYLDQRLVAAAGSSALASLPAPLRIPLSQPLFILGLIFILIILFRPGGIASLFPTPAGRDEAGAAATPVARWRRALMRRGNGAPIHTDPDQASRRRLR
ncbi:MAG: branched-chain amino acid ABC transporter permease [Rhodanobacteraceae bacterium]